MKPHDEKPPLFEDKVPSAPWRPNILKTDVDVPDNLHVNVPKKNHIPGVYIIMMLFGTTFVGLGISSLASLSGLLVSKAMTFFTSATGWDLTVAGLVWGILCFFIATVIFVGAARGKEVADRMRMLLDAGVDNQNTEFYDLSVVDTKFMLKEFKRRGCQIYADPDGKGVHVHCDDYAYTADQRLLMSGQIDVTTPSRRFIEFFGLQVFPIIYTVFVYYGFAGYSSWVWWFWLFLVVGPMFIMLDNHVIPLWFTIIYWAIYLALAYLWFVPNLAFSMWWTFVAIAIIWTMVCAIIYYLKRNLCTQQYHWYCDRL